MGFREGQCGLRTGEHSHWKYRVMVGRALQISIWILQLLSQKEEQEEKGGEEQGMVPVWGGAEGGQVQAHRGWDCCGGVCMLL